MNVKAGQVYKSFRSDIFPPKEKYQLYFDDKTVLLINSEKSKRNVSVYLKKEECSLLDYDSYICIDNIFKFEPQYKILNVVDINTSALLKLKNMINVSSTMPKVHIKKIEEAITQIIASRESLD